MALHLRAIGRLPDPQEKHRVKSCPRAHNDSHGHASTSSVTKNHQCCRQATSEESEGHGYRSDGASRVVRQLSRTDGCNDALRPQARYWRYDGSAAASGIDPEAYRGGGGDDAPPSAVPAAYVCVRFAIIAPA
jgi:hypothetical protein